MMYKSGVDNILVNNVGAATPKSLPWHFLETPGLINYINDIIAINMLTCTSMSKYIMLLVKMMGQQVVINVSSFGAITPCPQMSVYSGTKAYIHYLSQALNQEYLKIGTHHKSLTPGFIKTNLTKSLFLPNWFMPSSCLYVEGALEQVNHYDSTSGFNYHHLVKILILDMLNFQSCVTGINFTSKLIQQVVNIYMIIYKLDKN